MNVIKRIVSAIGATAVISSCVVSIPTVYADEAESPIVYRTSCEGSSADAHWLFTYTLSARENGNLHINIQCCGTDTSHTYIQEIGKITLDEDKIAPFDESGYGGVSTFTKNGDSSYITSYNNSFVMYTVINTDWVTGSYVGKSPATIDLYVKEPCLNTNIDINLFGTDVTIPYGDLSSIEPTTEFDNNDEAIEALNNRIAELEAIIVEKDNTINTFDNEREYYKNAYYEACVRVNEITATNETIVSENNILRDRLAEIENGITRFDTDGNGLIDSVDASTLLLIYSINSTGGNINTLDDLDEYLRLSENDINDNENDLDRDEEDVPYELSGDWTYTINDFTVF